jgi:hypothetical protein
VTIGAILAVLGAAAAAGSFAWIAQGSRRRGLTRHFVEAEAAERARVIADTPDVVQAEHCISRLDAVLAGVLKQERPLWQHEIDVLDLRGHCDRLGAALRPVMRGADLLGWLDVHLDHVAVSGLQPLRAAGAESMEAVDPIGWPQLELMYRVVVQRQELDHARDCLRQLRTVLHSDPAQAATLRVLHRLQRGNGSACKP